MYGGCQVVNHLTPRAHVCLVILQSVLASRNKERFPNASNPLAENKSNQSNYEVFISVRGPVLYFLMVIIVQFDIFLNYCYNIEKLLLVLYY